MENFKLNDEQLLTALKGGNFGLEKENLRLTYQGTMAQTPDPFCNEKNIVKDFCENQVEINTDVHDSAAKAVAQLAQITQKVRYTLAGMETPEILWNYSNPPVLLQPEDVPIAQYYGDEAHKTEYRKYLARQYGTYRMAHCGIHVNFSFPEELFKEVERTELYLAAARAMVRYGWILTAITAASPLVDSSYVELGHSGQTLFTGMASIRASESGYWNDFIPILNYSSADNYVKSIQRYIDKGYLTRASELYYPIRLKCAGTYSMEGLRENITHIEMRMFDVNPLLAEGVDVRDVKFVQYLMVYLLSQPSQPLLEPEQIHGGQHFKEAAHYDLDLVRMTCPDGQVRSMRQEGVRIITDMEHFYKDLYAECSPEDEERYARLRNILEFQKNKFLHPETRYAARVRKKYGNDIVEGLLQTELFLNYDEEEN